MWLLISLSPMSGGLVPIHIRRGRWGVMGPFWQEEQRRSKEHSSNEDSENLQCCQLWCCFSEQSKPLWSSPWSCVTYKSQRPLEEKTATAHCWSKDGPIISGWLYVAKWLQLAAWLSAGHKPLPEVLPHQLFLHTHNSAPPPLLSSCCFSSHISPVLFCQSVKSGNSNATLPFLRNHPSLWLWGHFTQSWPYMFLLLMLLVTDDLRTQIPTHLHHPPLLPFRLWSHSYRKCKSGLTLDAWLHGANDLSLLFLFSSHILYLQLLMFSVVLAVSDPPLLSVAVLSTGAHSLRLYLIGGISGLLGKQAMLPTVEDR